MLVFRFLVPKYPHNQMINSEQLQGEGQVTSITH